MQTGGKKGMQTMEQALAELVLRGIITQEDRRRPLEPARDADRSPQSSLRRGRRGDPAAGRAGLESWI